MTVVTFTLPNEVLTGLTIAGGIFLYLLLAAVVGGITLHISGDEDHALFAAAVWPIFVILSPFVWLARKIGGKT